MACDWRASSALSPCNPAVALVQSAAHSVLPRVDAEQSIRALKAARHTPNCARVIGDPCPGTAILNGVAQIASSAVRQPPEQAVSRNGAGRVTRSPTAATRLLGSN